jgi:hypothetical protein
MHHGGTLPRVTNGHPLYAILVIVPGTDSGQTHTYSTATDAIGALFVIGILCLLPAVSANLIVRIVIPVFGVAILHPPRHRFTA